MLMPIDNQTEKKNRVNLSTILITNRYYYIANVWNIWQTGINVYF